jgi:hypothetical protein
VTTYRQARQEESRVLYGILRVAIDDLVARMSPGTDTGTGDPDAWERSRPLWEHLARTAESTWLAIDDSGQPIGYARSILRDGDRELTEFFVIPGAQAAGIGRELLARAFPAGKGARHRSIIATPDPRALSRYFKTGVTARFAIATFSRTAERPTVATDLALEPIGLTRSALAALGRIDRRVLAHRRDEEHRWLVRVRSGVLARRRASIVGYAYAGRALGPIAALEPADMPALLAWAESATAATVPGGVASFEVPFPNQSAIGYLLGRGYRIDPFLTHYLSDGPSGRFDRYIVTSPPVFV